MHKKGPIVIVEDDQDDLLVLLNIFEGLNVKQKVKSFENGRQALSFLQETKEQPALVLCDINMPVMNGKELRQAILHDETLRERSIPFIFLTSSSNPNEIKEAYKFSIQGYFVKRGKIDDQVALLESILDYWTAARVPNDY